MVIRLKVAGEEVRAPDWVTRTGWSLHGKGYVIYTSRAVRSGVRRGARMHRVVMEGLLGRKLEEDEHVHHMDFNKRNNCGCNLVLMPACMNPTGALRDPYTGAFMSRDQYVRRYGGW